MLLGRTQLLRRRLDGSPETPIAEVHATLQTVEQVTRSLAQQVDAVEQTISMPRRDGVPSSPDD